MINLLILFFSFLPDREREEEENRLREQLRKEWVAKQEKLKNEDVEITYSYWYVFFLVFIENKQNPAQHLVFLFLCRYKFELKIYLSPSLAQLANPNQKYRKVFGSQYLDAAMESTRTASRYIPLRKKV